MMSKNKDFQLVVGINKYAEAAPFIFFHGDNIKDSKKQDIVSNIKFEAIITSIKNNFLHQRMAIFLNKVLVRV